MTVYSFSSGYMLSQLLEVFSSNWTSYNISPVSYKLETYIS